MRCNQCGKENKDGARFCAFCGAALTEPIPEKIPETSEKTGKKKKKKWWILVLLLLLFSAIIIAVLLAVRGKDPKRQYEKYIKDGERYIEELEYAKAETAFLNAIDIEPKKIKPYVQLADVYIVQEKYEDAKDILDKANDVIDKLEEEEPEKAEEEEKYKEEIQDRLDDVEEIIHSEEDFDWVVEPTIEADDIYYTRDFDVDRKTLNELNLQIMGEYAVIQKDGNLGLIDMDGKMKGGMDYLEIYSFDGELILYDADHMFLLRGDEIVETGGTSYWYFALYLANGQLELLQLMDYEGLVSKPCDPIDRVIPLPEYHGDYEIELPMDVMRPKYAICNKGELVADFIYDECGTENNGLLAVKQNGKWGYADTSGKIVVPIEYDSSWDNYFLDLSGERAGKFKEYCYAATEGYVPLRKGNAWSLADTSGNIVIPEGVFEAIRPVYDGKCWVKKDGKWGVIALGKEVQEEKTEDIKEASSEWKQAYIDYMNQKEQEYSGHTYNLLYINDDEIPELLVSTGVWAGGETLCTWYNGNITEQACTLDGVSYIEKSGLFMNSGFHSGRGWDEVLHLENGVFTIVGSGKKTLSDASGSENRSCSWNDVPLSSEEEYKNEISKIYDSNRAVSADCEYSYEEILDKINNMQ